MSDNRSSNSDLSRREILKYGLYGGIAAALPSGLWLGSCGRWQRQRKPNIILITLDTTRADHLGCYGYRRPASPNLDKLANESVLYTRAVSPSSWTLPSHASLFTGKFPSSHGAQYDSNGPLHLVDVVSYVSDSYRARGLAMNELTLAQILKEAGYITGAVVGGPWLKRVFGLDKGFDYYDDGEIGTLNGRLAEQVTDSAISWLKRLQESGFFLFLNYFDPHDPYLPPGDYPMTFLPKDTKLYGRLISSLSLEEKEALYDAEILYMDHHIARLLQELKSRNLYDNTLIIVTSDHGEEFFDHGKFLHGHSLYQEQIHVPLFIKYPGKEISPDRKDVPVQLTDILPMICKWLGITIPDGVQGGVPPHIGHPVFAEVYPLPIESAEGDWRTIFDGDFKFIWNSKGNHLLFHLGNDPAEKFNLVSQEPRRAERMLSKLNQYLAKLPGPGPTAPAKELDDNTKKALKSLGYVK